MPSRGWIGVDFDGTLAHYLPGSFPALGVPIAAMVERVKRWLDAGWEVRIVTARVDDCLLNVTRGNEVLEDRNQRKALIEWCQEHIGQPVVVTNRKDYDMIVLYDDRCRQVNKNEGSLAGEEFELIWQ